MLSADELLSLCLLVKRLTVLHCTGGPVRRVIRNSDYFSPFQEDNLTRRYHAGPGFGRIRPRQAGALTAGPVPTGQARPADTDNKPKRVAEEDSTTDGDQP